MSQEVLTLLQEIFQVCVVPLFGVLTAYIIKFINYQAKELSAKTDNELSAKYINMLADTITVCVQATNQTYVNSLKDKNAFDADAQKQAFQMTLNAVLSVLSEDATKYLTEAYGDLNTYITNQIEATVSQNRINA